MECGGCTLCCKLLDLPWVESPTGEWCRYCDPRKGCEIHEEKPEECRLFKCAWLKMERVKPELRPDRSKVIWDAVNDHIMFGVHDPNFKMKKIVVKQSEDFVKNGSSVVMHTLGLKPQIAVAKGHKHKEVWRETLEKYKEYLDDAA
jgi:hypothetical protein